MECRLETITPRKAADLLKLNTKNRSLNERKVDEYAEAMLRGEWKVNGETIKVNEHVLVDGQKRLHAVLKSGVTIRSYIARGIEPDAYDTVDTGQPRTIGDGFSRDGEAHYNNLAAAVRWLHCYWSGANFRLRAPTMTQAHKIVTDHPTIRDSVHFIRGFKLRGLIGYGSAAGLHYEMKQRDEQAANAFWEAVAGGERLTKTMPEYLIRERMQDNSKSHQKVRPHVIFAMTIKAWNARRHGKSIKCLRWSESEDFPTIE